MQNALNLFRKSSGFTLIESLISFSILLLLSNMMIVILYSIVNIDNRSQSFEEYEFFIFFEEIQRELYDAKTVSITDDSLLIMSPAKTVSYSQYQDIVRRRVNGLGHELVLQSVADFEVQIVNNRLRSIVTFLNGKTMAKDWFTIQELEFIP